MNQPQVRKAKGWMERAWANYLEVCDVEFNTNRQTPPDYALVEEYARAYEILASLYDWRYLVANLPDDCYCTPRDGQVCDVCMDAINARYGDEIPC